MLRLQFHPFLLHFILFSSASAAAAELRCGLCGGETAVPYPFSTAADCGDQAYKLHCNSTTAELHFISNTGVLYPIESISADSRRMILRPPSLIPGACLSADFAGGGFRLDESLPFEISGSNTILLLNCTENTRHSPIDCSNNSPCRTYTDNAPPAAACKKAAPPCCSFQTGGSDNASIVRIDANGCLAYQSYVDLDPARPFSEWPAPSLEVTWTAPLEPVCTTSLDCNVLPFSECSPDPAGGRQRRCLCKNGRNWDPVNGECQGCRKEKGCKRHKSQGAIYGSAAALIAILAVIGFIVSRHRQHKTTIAAARKSLIKEREEILSASASGTSSRLFSGKEIKRATDDFCSKNLLGSGGFGEVFRGILEDGTDIAVKRAKPGNAKGTAQVLNEVRILCQVNHRSLVRLLGCCVDDLEQPLLIYEYVPNGTLFDHLHRPETRKKTPLTWLQRLLIAHKTADGLAYLHSSAVPPIFHRDVKSSNILLEDNLDVKVSDFGLSRLAEISENDSTYIHTSAQGTLGYLDPEYYLNLQLTDRSDVYSFGVVLLELLTCKKAIDFNREEEDVNLVVYMKRIFHEDKLLSVIDPILRDGASEIEIETIKAVGNLAAACLDDRRQNRPSMKEVAEELQIIINIIAANASKT
ncbi:wall-associated receptor kinase-like 20 [Andrographis paniculata]|uniref:wall-associated receptor kinase-like 20 n=1 Tax=Andrographis paniculata TaxID=175694 RepID=UPI0021E84E0D|nr:wall-associated receptor kinase-like 20 [Andrographis paniculata]